MPREATFFDGLAALLELERAEHRARFEEARGQLSDAERQDRGLSLLALEVLEEDIGLGGRLLLTLGRADRQPLPSRWYPGDPLELRTQQGEESPGARGVVVRSSDRTVQVAFDRPPPFPVDGRLRADKLPDEVTFDRARSAVERVKAMEHGVARRRREILLGNEPPRRDRPPPLEPTRPLNPEQQTAVEQALAAQDFHLVHGPPGTGKSTVLAEVAVQAVRSGARLLATAASNAAVDHLLELLLEAGLSAIRVGHPARVLPKLQPHTLDLLVEEHPDRVLARELFDEGFELLGYARKQRTRGRSRERFAKARQSQREAYALFDEARALEKKALSTVLERAQVLCATCTALEGSVLAGRTFDLVLLDEATQATEPLALLAVLRAPKVVLAGDPQQLPPTVLSQRAAREGLAKSLFERLLEDHGEPSRTLLKEQHRMHADIMTFPSEQMYGGQLRAHPAVAGRLLKEVLGAQAPDVPPVLFLDTAGKGFDDELEPGSKSHRNPGEAELVVSWARTLLSAGLPPTELALIAPYSAQVALLRSLLPVEGVEIDTVDAFQGREKEAVLLSMTRSNADAQVGFVADVRRMNVALTRAKRHLFVVGDSATLSGHPFYARLLAHTQATGAYRSAWEWEG